MSRFAYVNGRYVPHQEASTPIEDRGYQFADGIYEVIAVVKGNFIDFQEHLDRLEYSLAELKIPSPVPRRALVHICQEIIRLNRLQDAMIYIQVTRGVAPRYHSFPKNPRPVLVVTARHVNQRHLMANKAHGVAAITLLDSRWARPDIKSISLLPNILSKQQAEEQGCYEAILHKTDGTVTEASATNVWIVPQEGVLQTHPLSQSILGGITRQRLIKLAQQNGMQVEEKSFTVSELKSAQEVLLSASVSGITPVIKVDQTIIGEGKAGSVARTLMQLYLDYTGG